MACVPHTLHRRCLPLLQAASLYQHLCGLVQQSPHRLLRRAPSSGMWKKKFFRRTIATIQYYNLPHIAHNMSVLVILTLLYSVFGVVLCRRYRQMGGQRQFKKELSVSVGLNYVANVNRAGTFCSNFMLLSVLPLKFLPVP